MNNRDAELILSSLRGYSSEASTVLEYIHKYDYRSEAAAWDTNRHPSLLEVEHPTLYDLFIRLAHYINQTNLNLTVLFIRSEIKRMSIELNFVLLLANNTFAIS